MILRQLNFSIDENLADDLSLILEEDAVSSAWYEEKTNHWVFQVVFKENQGSILEKKIKDFFERQNLSLPPMTKSVIKDKDWVASVYRDSPPLTIGRFYVYGVHIQGFPPKNLIPLHIEAATAFGSGQHESTEGCLKALSLLEKERHFMYPLDMGCGSGILAIAMACLWKKLVIACDNDPEAVRVTLENAEKNNVKPWIQAKVSEGFSVLPGKTFDIITANILAGPLCQMVEDVERTLMPGGFIVLSGLLNRQAEGVVETYRSVGMRLINQIFVGEWSTLIMRKENHG